MTIGCVARGVPKPVSHGPVLERAFLPAGMVVMRLMSMEGNRQDVLETCTPNLVPTPPHDGLRDGCPFDAAAFGHTRDLSRHVSKRIFEPLNVQGFETTSSDWIIEQTLAMREHHRLTKDSERYISGIGECSPPSGAVSEDRHLVQVECKSSAKGSTNETFS